MLKWCCFFLSRDGECDDKTKALALGILGKFLQCTSPVVSVVSFNGCVCLPFEAAFPCCDDCSVHSTKQAFFTLLVNSFRYLPEDTKQRYRQAKFLPRPTKGYMLL